MVILAPCLEIVLSSSVTYCWVFIKTTGILCRTFPELVHTSLSVDCIGIIAEIANILATVYSADRIRSVSGPVIAVCKVQGTIRGVLYVNFGNNLSKLRTSASYLEP